jgi:DNA-binding beta-propeller fold protein YncE
MSGIAPYRMVADWPRYPKGMDFEMGSGVAVDDEGIIYLFTRDREHWAAHPLAMSAKMGKSSISRFDREGNFLGKWGPSDEPGFALGAHTLYFIDGCFWTVDRDGHMVKKYSKDGRLLLSLGELGQWGDGPYRFNGPTGVTVQKNGNIVVTDGYWNARMIWYSPQGEYIKEIGGWGDGPGQFNSPHAVAQTPDGRLLVVDFQGGALHPYMTVDGQIAEHRKVKDPNRKGRIQVFDPDGAFLEEWTHIKPLSIAVYGDRIYASDELHDLVVLDATTFQELERHKNLAIYIHQMAMDQHGDIYVATVYPEHAGGARGPLGPSHHRWTREPAAAAAARPAVGAGA